MADSKSKGKRDGDAPATRKVLIYYAVKDNKLDRNRVNTVEELPADDADTMVREGRAAYVPDDTKLGKVDEDKLADIADVEATQAVHQRAAGGGNTSSSGESGVTSGTGVTGTTAAGTR